MVLVYCLFTTDSNQEIFLCFFFSLIISTTQDNCHFPSQGCISFVAYNVIPLYLSVKCLETFAAVLLLSGKALLASTESALGFYSVGAGLISCTQESL